jgi:hypothetical protein
MNNLDVVTTRVYLGLRGEFDPTEISDFLGLSPEKSWRMGEARPVQGTYSFSSWILGVEPRNTPILEDVVDEVMQLFEGKADKLVSITKKHDIDVVLECVVWFNETTPALSLRKDQIAWLAAIGAFLDIDQYPNYDTSEI